MTDLWVEASRDLEGEHAALRMAHAKLSVAGLWPFLALAQSEHEFGHRLALASEHIDNLVAEDLLPAVLSSLREDFRMLAADDPPSKSDEEDRTRSTDDGDEDDDPDEADSWRDLGRREGVVHPGDLLIFHVGSQRWVRVATEEAPEGGGNPYYFTGGPEGGPNTGQTNQFPPHPTGADPVDPLNQMYPAQPQPWTVPPGGEWKEAPMQFSPPTNRTAAGETARTAANPQYFAGGQEGVAGSNPPSFPEDLAVEDPDDRVNELYDHMNPQPEVDTGEKVANRAWGQPVGNDEFGFHTGQTWSGGMPDPEPDHPAPDSNKLQGTEFDSPQERERWNKAQAGEQQDSRASTTFTAGRRGFFDPSDAGVRMVAAGNMFQEENPFNSAPAGVNNGPTQVTNMGPGNSGAGDMGMGGAVPQSTPPRTMPSGGGGMDPAMDPGGEDPTKTARRRVAEQTRNLASDDDPTGYGDEFEHNVYERGGPMATRPRQDAGARAINTPQRPGQPIPTTSSPGPGAEAEEDDDRREASLVASRIVAGLANR